MKPEIPVLLGTYTESLPHVEGRGPGIVPCRLNLETGSIHECSEAVAVRNPAYLWRNDQHLYATSEITDFEGGEDGCLSLLEIEGDKLQPRQFVSSGGSGPAWVRGDTERRWLLVANYLEGNCRIFPLDADGRMGLPVCEQRFSGSGPDPERQESSHPHAMLASPDNRHVYLADLGTDQVAIFDFDASIGRIENPSSHACPPGTGPRHLLFDPTGHLLFLVLELSSELAVFERDSNDGSLRLLSRTSSVPPGTTGNHPSEFALTRDGSHLYFANRGHDSIAHFRIDPKSGATELIATIPCSGRIPRHLALSPDDSCLLVANQESNRVVSFHRNAADGKLQATGHGLDIGTPCFVLF